MIFRKRPPERSGYVWYVIVDYPDPQIGFYLHPTCSGHIDVDHYHSREQYRFGDMVEKPRCVDNTVE